VGHSITVKNHFFQETERLRVRVRAKETPPPPPLRTHRALNRITEMRKRRQHARSVEGWHHEGGVASRRSFAGRCSCSRVNLAQDHPAKHVGTSHTPQPFLWAGAPLPQELPMPNAQCSQGRKGPAPTSECFLRAPTREGRPRPPPAAPRSTWLPLDRFSAFAFGHAACVPALRLLLYFFGFPASPSRTARSALSPSP